MKRQMYSRIILTSWLPSLPGKMCRQQWSNMTCAGLLCSTLLLRYSCRLFLFEVKTTADGVGIVVAVVHMGESAQYLMPHTPAPTGGCRTCCLCQAGLLLPLASCESHEPPLGQQAASPPENSSRLCVKKGHVAQGGH